MNMVHLTFFKRRKVRPLMVSLQGATHGRQAPHHPSEQQLYMCASDGRADRTPPNSIRISPPSHLHPPTHLHLHATAGVSQCILAQCNTDTYISLSFVFQCTA